MNLIACVLDWWLAASRFYLLAAHHFPVQLGAGHPLGYLLGTLETSTTTILDPDALAKPIASSTESGARSVSTSFADGKTLYVGIDELPWLVGSSTSTSVLGPTDEAGIAIGTGARRSLGSNEYGVSSSSCCGTYSTTLDAQIFAFLGTFSLHLLTFSEAIRYGTLSRGSQMNM